MRFGTISPVGIMRTLTGSGFPTVRKTDGSLVTLDVRRHELARLDEDYARRVIRRLRHPKTNKRSKDNG